MPLMIDCDITKENWSLAPILESECKSDQFGSDPLEGYCNKTLPKEAIKFQQGIYPKLTTDSFSYSEYTRISSSHSSISEYYEEQILASNDEIIMAQFDLSRTKTKYSNSPSKCTNNTSIENIIEKYIRKLNKSVDLIPDEITIMNSQKWLDELKELILLKQMDWDVPLITTGFESEIVFEWWCDNRKITIYFLNESIEYLKSWGKRINSEMADGIVENHNDMLKLWQWLKNERG